VEHVGLPFLFSSLSVFSVMMNDKVRKKK
jgi:hypothetical protein